jgi:hemolysin activation/secretion protein
MDIWEYRIEGADLLSQSAVERAVYPYLGPGRTIDDVEAARAALEAAYTDQGYQTVAVSIPQQQVRGGVVTLEVTEGTVGRLRVRGARYYDLDAIKAAAPSLAEGSVPKLDDVSEDIVALNQQPDRRVTPAIKAGRVPGTVDVDLNVDDTLPLHGSLELNNRYSADTTKLRLNASLRYDNLWQLGHSLSLAYQVAPKRRSDAEVLSASYLARFPALPRLSLLGYWVKQDSDVNTLGSFTVAGKGSIAGLRGIVSLPGDSDFFHSLTVGADRKQFKEKVTLGDVPAYTAPVTYFPLSANYMAGWMGLERSTNLTLSVTANFRALGSDWEDFDNKRSGATGNFLALRGEADHTESLDLGAELFAKLQGQLSRDALISSEQFAAGGLDTVRGYLESEAMGDQAAGGTVELRSPSLTAWLGDDIVNDWRIYPFVDGAVVTLNDALPEQKDRFGLWSFGVGTRLQLLDHLHGSLDVGVPMVAQGDTERKSTRVHFRAWGEF